LKGFPEAINAVYPETQLQLCIVHMVRNSLRLVAWKDYKAVTRDLKQVYHTATEEGALQALDAFGKEWDARYPQISRSWQANWPNVATFFVYPEASRKVIINNRQYGAPLTLTSVMVLSDCYSWANEQFGHASLGDPRRTRRLVSLASSLAQHAGLSIVKSSQSTAQVEGAYRLMRNPSVSPEAIAEAGFTATARACEAHPLLLALEDTTTISFSHSTAFDDLGNTTTNPKTRGLLAHSVLM
ncbi:transposase, partial [Escherichia coli]|uniref:IS4/Tn5 family transposase DNA-binding protein n=4 Tax=Enterobacteriaceae TaxID=543 RepID=UPI001EEE9A1D